MNRFRFEARIAAIALVTPFAVAALAAQAAQEVAVHGKVVDSAGVPLSAIVVQITDGAGRRQLIKTDRKGNFSVIGLQRGQVRVETNHFGFDRDVISMGMKAGDAAQCQISLARTAQSGGQSRGSCRLIPDGYDTTVVQ